jgi:hypothetical protein
MNFAIPHLLTYKTQKLTKASENNKAKGLTNVNQGVQIHNIWHSSVIDATSTPHPQLPIDWFKIVIN